MNAALAATATAWCIWIALLVAIRIAYDRLGSILGPADSPEWADVEYRDGSLDPLEAFRWYFRFRRFASRRRALEAQEPNVGITLRKVHVLMLSAEFLACGLLIAITVLGLHSFNHL